LQPVNPQREDTLVSPPPGVLRRSRLRLSRRPLIAFAAGVIVVAAVVVAIASGAFSSTSPNSSSLDNSFPTGVATVTRQSLTQQTQVSATLGFADPSTVVMPAGTQPSALTQTQQAVSSAQAQLASAQAALATDSQSLAQAQASLSANRAKLTVDCSGDNAASSSSAGGSGGGSGSGPCATDAQAVSTNEQSVTQASAKVAGDRQQASTAQTGLASAQTSLTQAQASATFYGQSSTYTELPAVGAIVDRGQTLFEVNGQPVVVLHGTVAPWRAFETGMSPGKDVAELNANLRALGYGNALSGDTFTAATVQAIDAFQRAHGVGESGELLLGSVVFEPGPVRVTSVTPTVGATVQAGPVLQITSTRRQVTIALDAAQQSNLKVGDPVTITLPDNSTTPGRVSHVGTVATVPSGSGGGNGSGTPTIQVDVTPTEPAATGHLDQAPVNVSITTASVANALTAPVNALLALANGGYAVEVAGAGGVHHLVGVQLGLFDDATGYVQIAGTTLTPGTRVVIPGQ
jgi:putative peptidoglycan binding protein